MSGIAAKGAIFAYKSSTEPSTFSTIPGIGDFDLPVVGERDKIDVTSHDSVGDYEEKILGVIRTPTISIKVNKWDATNTHHASLVTRAKANTLTNFKVTTKDTKVRTFAGYVASVVENQPVNGAISATISIEITGAISDAA